MLSSLNDARRMLLSETVFVTYGRAVLRVCPCVRVCALYATLALYVSFLVLLKNRQTMPASQLSGFVRSSFSVTPVPVSRPPALPRPAHPAHLPAAGVPASAAPRLPRSPAAHGPDTVSATLAGVSVGCVAVFSRALHHMSPQTS